MAIDQELYERLMKKHGKALREATKRRHTPEGEMEAKILHEQLPDLDAAGDTTAIMIRKRQGKKDVKED